jgi:hypothetical protein
LVDLTAPHNARSAVLERILHGPRMAPSALRLELPEAIDEVVLRALSVDPAARYPSVRALADAFVLALGDRTRTTPGVSSATATATAFVDEVPIVRTLVLQEVEETRTFLRETAIVSSPRRWVAPVALAIGLLAGGAYLSRPDSVPAPLVEQNPRPIEERVAREIEAAVLPRIEAQPAASEPAALTREDAEPAPKVPIAPATAPSRGKRGPIERRASPVVSEESAAKIRIDGIARSLAQLEGGSGEEDLRAVERRMFELVESLPSEKNRDVLHRKITAHALARDVPGLKRCLAEIRAELLN